MNCCTYAKLDSNNIVVDVIHLNEDEVADMATLTQITTGRLKKVTNNAGIGYVFDVELNNFIPPKPYPSWILNTTTLEWESPLGDCPSLANEQTVTTDSGYVISGYTWDEDAYQADNSTGWVLRTIE